MLACRDAFPMELIPEANRLVQKCMSLKMNGEVASFMVVAAGRGCIPVLEAKERLSSGQIARWAVYQDMNEMRQRMRWPPARPHPPEIKGLLGRGSGRYP